MSVTENRFRRYGLLGLKGFCMGAADVVPGVSGGTMALILGIYRELIMAIRSFDLQWVKAIMKPDFTVIAGRPHFSFLVPLVTGILCALLFFTRVVKLPELLQVYPEQVYGLFFGLITGSIVILFREKSGLGMSGIGLLLSGLIAGLLVFNMVPVMTPESSWFIFVAGALAICAMILPGISGSFILLILNKYTYIFNAIGYFKLSILVPFALGAITGLVAFSRILSWLLERYYRGTILFITGILLASLWVIWPFQVRVYETVGSSKMLVSATPVLPASYDTGFWSTMVLVVLGTVIVIGIQFLASDKTRSISSAE